MSTVADMMSQPVRTVTTADVVGPIRDLMLDGRVHGIPVLDAKGALAGIVTASDLVEEWSPNQGVETVMTERMVTISPHSTLADAARLMLQEQIHHLVVVERDKVVGMFSSFDLLREFAVAAEETESLDVHERAHAQPGDVVVIRGHAVDSRERRGVIVDVRGRDGGPPFVVRWLDDPHAEPHDVLFFPGSDADIEPAESPSST